MRKIALALTVAASCCLLVPQDADAGINSTTGDKFPNPDGPYILTGPVEYDNDNILTKLTFAPKGPTTLLPSAGASVFPAESFFDVFVEVDLPGLGTGGGMYIDSFFDVFTELRIQGPEVSAGAGMAAASTAGLFDTEIVSMSLSGSPNPPGPVRVRVLPGAAGEYDITDLGGGLYHIDSFFDVFTELSVDGGESWVGQKGAMQAHLILTPEPTTMALLAIGGVGVLRRRRRKRR